MACLSALVDTKANCVGCHRVWIILSSCCPTTTLGSGWVRSPEDDERKWWMWRLLWVVLAYLIKNKNSLLPCIHCKNYSNVHFKSQNYSCVLDSHTCLGDRISCCRKISGDKSKIKAVILMEIIKTTESRSQIYTGIFLSLSLWQWKKLHQQYSLSNRQGVLSNRQGILSM